MSAPAEVRAEIIYEHLKNNVRKHFTRRELANATGIPFDDITPDVLKRVRSLAMADGFMIPSAIGTGLYVLTDVGEDVVEPMMASAGAGVSYTKIAEIQAKWIQDHIREFPRKEQTWLRKALKSMISSAVATQDNWDLVRASYREFEKTRRARQRAEKAEAETRIAREEARAAREASTRQAKNVGIALAMYESAERERVNRGL